LARIDYAMEPTNNPTTGVPVLNLVRMMSHYPAKDVWMAVGGHLIQKGVLDPVLREVVILRTGRLSGSDYEVVQHHAFGKALNMSQEAIDSSEHGRTAGLSEREQLALRMTEEIHGQGALSEATFRKAQQSFSTQEIIEIHLVIGFYRTTATFLRSFDVDIDADTGAGAKAVYSNR
jgi:alkylhydroperoxidase family enzyme